jgi:hypothetical protein
LSDAAPPTAPPPALPAAAQPPGPGRRRRREAGPNLSENRTAPAARLRRFLTPERRRAFLAALRECGSVAEAVRRASSGRRSTTTFYDQRARDPEFAREWDDAIAEALGRIEAALFARATVGQVTRENYDAAGNLVAVQRMFSDAAALAILRVRDPAWGEALARRELDVTATARVEAVAGRPADLSALTTEELRQLELLASKVR